MEVKGNLVIVAETHPKIEGVCGETCPWYNPEEGSTCRLFGFLQPSVALLASGQMAFDRHEKCLAGLHSREFYRQTKRWRNDENGD